LLQSALSAERERTLAYYVFDVLFLDGEDVREKPLTERKKILKAALSGADEKIRYSAHVVGEGPAFFDRASKLGLEGIVSKRASGTYRSGRSRDWLKVKCTHRQEFIIGGFTKPEGARSHFGALHVGVMNKHGLAYAGKVGTGFSAKSLAEIYGKLTKLLTEEPPFTDPPQGAEAVRSQWVRPVLVCEVEFTERTKDGKIRHPTFRGLRSDKPAEDVVLEVEQAAPRPKPKPRSASKKR
jgi:bifunctional non-homologous end joining protein LigD